MKHVYLILFTIVCTELSAQDPELYFTGFDTPSQRAGWTQYRLGEVVPFSQWEANNYDPYSDSNSLIHLYPVAAFDPVDDWYVSKSFNMSLGGTIDSVWTKYTGFGVPMNDDTVALYLITGNQDPELAQSITLLHVFTDSAYHNDSVWRSVRNIGIPTTLDSAYLAFRYYTSTSNWLDVRFDDLGMTLPRPLGVESDAVADGFRLFPNPSNGTIGIDYHGDEAQAIICNLQGQQVWQGQIAGPTSIDGLPKGLYSVTLIAGQGSTSRRFVVQQ